MGIDWEYLLGDDVDLAEAWEANIPDDNYDYDDDDYYEEDSGEDGGADGSAVIEDTYKGYRFTDADKEVLRSGRILEIPDVSGRQQHPRKIGVRFMSRQPGRPAKVYPIYWCTEFSRPDGAATYSVSFPTDDGWKNFSRRWGSHEFSPEELEALIAGQTITFPYTASNGRSMTAVGKLMMREYNGRSFLGFALQQDTQ